MRLLLRIIEEEAGKELAAKIERRVHQALGGQHIYIAKARSLTREDIESAGPDPRQAARRLGIHQSTAYRLIR